MVCGDSRPRQRNKFTIAEIPIIFSATLQHAPFDLRMRALFFVALLKSKIYLEAPRQAPARVRGLMRGFLV
jgi:hypothetical protein